MSPRMRVNPPVPKVKWKVLAVGDKDPERFAEKMQSALQGLVDDGFSIVSQMQRSDALIITATRMGAEEEPRLARRRPAALPKTGSVTEEVLYHYLENGTQKQASRTSMVDMLRLVLNHLGRDDVLPVSLVAATMTRFEPKDFPSLLKLFGEELAHGESEPLE